MKLQKIKHIIKSKEYSYLLGRFYHFRKIYSLARGLYQAKLSNFDLPYENYETVFDDIDVERIVCDLRHQAIGMGFTIPDSLVKEIYQYAANSPCFSKGVHNFFYRDVCNGKLPSGEKIALAQVRAPMKCRAVNMIASDKNLWDICCQYLGYWPKLSVRLFWSPVSDLSDDDRRNLSQTIDFHFDVHNFNFCYVHFYITDTDKNSGAHELVLASHKQKPLLWLLGPASKSIDRIKAYYSAEQMLTVEGVAGAGFFEDTSCYHRAIPPKTSDRLLLQLRFY
jgi:hypothetical protein